MEIVFPDPYYDSEREGEDYAPELRALLFPFDPTVNVYSTNIGHNADYPAYLIQIFSSIDWSTLLTAGTGAVFFLGKKINENIDAWLEIGGTVRKLVEKLSFLRIDELAATVLVLKQLESKLDKNGDLSITVQLVEFSQVPWGKYKLDKRPDALYLVTVKNGGKAHILGIKLDSSIAFQHEFGLAWYEFSST
jgi:hypothetical protein